MPFNWPLATKAAVIAGAAFYIVYDIVVYKIAGGQATESTTVGTWMDGSLWVLFLVLLLVGHLAASGPHLWTWKHFLVAALACAVGYFLTAYG
jgi:hypothetical protein